MVFGSVYYSLILWENRFVVNYLVDDSYVCVINVVMYYLIESN